MQRLLFKDKKINVREIVPVRFAEQKLSKHLYFVFIERTDKHMSQASTVFVYVVRRKVHSEDRESVL